MSLPPPERIDCCHTMPQTERVWILMGEKSVGGDWRDSRLTFALHTHGGGLDSIRLGGRIESGDTRLARSAVAVRRSLFPPKGVVETWPLPLLFVLKTLNPP